MLQRKKNSYCTEKIVNFIVIHVCVNAFSNIDSALFECLPWSTGADNQFVSLQVAPFQFSKNYQQYLVSATKIHHAASGFIKY